MAGITSRGYGGEADYQAIRKMLIESFALTGPPDYCTVGDLDWWRFTDNDPAAIWKKQLWLDGDRVVAVAWPSGKQVDLLVHPAYRQLENDMLAWTEQQALKVDDPAESIEIQAWSYTSDTQRTEVLHRRGYERDGMALVYRFREVDGKIEPPTLPDAYHFSNVRGEEDLERRVAAHRDAFSPSKMSVEKHRRVMIAPTYRPELDIMIVAPDGSVAAFCIV